MNTFLIRLLCEFFVIFALIFFVSRAAFAVDSTPSNRQACETAALKVTQVRCGDLILIAKNLQSLGDIPKDGEDCKRANQIYDQLSKKVYDCSQIRNLNGFCQNACRISPLQSFAVGCETHTKSSLNQLKGYSQKYPNLRTPSCNEETALSRSEYVEPTHPLPRPQSQVRTGFVPVDGETPRGEPKPDGSSPTGQ